MGDALAKVTVSADWRAHWLVLAGLVAYWIFILVRAILWRAVPWYFKLISVAAYPVAIVALLLPTYQSALLIPALALIVVGFVLDGLWRHTDILGRFDDPGRRPRAGRHRTS